MTDPLLRWEAMADDLQFNQLPAVRKQAETWRTGLAGLTGLIGASLIVKGRDSVADLATGWRVLVFVLLLAALILLIVATLAALNAASGEPGDTTLLTGEDLRSWTQQQVLSTQSSIRRARLLTLIGMTAIGIAVAATWLIPPTANAPALRIETVRSGPLCGRTGTASAGFVTVVTGSKPVTTTKVPLTEVVSLTPVARCP